MNADIALREATGSQDQLRRGLRQLQIANLRQRTDIHAYYNEKLRASCRLHGFGFINGATPFLGADGTVDPRYVIPEANGAEHHLNYQKTPDVIRELIWRRIDAAGQPHILIDDAMTADLAS